MDEHDREAVDGGTSRRRRWRVSANIRMDDHVAKQEVGYHFYKFV